MTARTPVEFTRKDGEGNYDRVGNSIEGYVGMLDELGNSFGLQEIDNKIRTSSMPYTYDIAEGNVADHIAWSNDGFTPAVGLTQSDVWSAGGLYVFPTTAQQMEAVSSDNTNDIGTVIKGDATGNTVRSDADGSLTTLTDADVDFTAATAVAAGDLVILDPHGASPSYGYVTSVAAHVLTCAGGFAKGLSGASRYYAVIDKSAHTGALAIGIQYLDTNYARRGEIVVLNGTTPVDTVNTNILRINEVRVIGTGANNAPIGNISVRNTAGAVTYGYITAGFALSRSSVYTVPDGFTLYITQITFSFGYAANQTHYARLYLRANRDRLTNFNTGNVFYPEAESVCANSAIAITMTVPLVFTEHTDIKASGIASTAAGVGVVVMRGWIEVE